MTGMHQAFPPIEMSLWATGGSFIFVVASMSNVAQGAAAAGVALTTKNKKVKGVATASAPSAFLGITEPAMFGVNLALRWPFYIAIVSAGIGAMAASILNVKAKALGAAGYPLATPMVITNSKKAAASVEDVQLSGVSVTSADLLLKVALKAKTNA